METMQFLLQAGAELESRDKWGWETQLGWRARGEGLEF